jgi:Glycosyltransferases, probably involved in cell wall biogenesis
MDYCKLKFSIIIPVYNAENYLEQCLDGILTQIYRNIEVILVNDGSKDKSGSICDKYVEKDSRFHVVHKDNQGVSSARNTGLDMATGDYIMFVDSDDWIEKDAIEKIYKILNNYPYEILMYGIVKDGLRNSRRIFKNSSSREFFTNREIIQELPMFIKSESVNSPIKVYKKSLIKSNSIIFNTGLDIAEDCLFNIQCFLEASSLYVIDDILYHYTIRENSSLSRKFRDNKFEKLKTVNNRLLELIRGKENYNNLKEALLYIRLKNVFSCFMDVFKDECPYSYEQRLQFMENILKQKEGSEFNIITDKRFKILAAIVKTNSRTLVYLVSKVIFILKKWRTV